MAAKITNIVKINSDRMKTSFHFVVICTKMNIKPCMQLAQGV